MKLPEVEFAVPLGTYYNSQEEGYAITTVHAASAPYNDGFARYGHILRDRGGNTVKLYTLSYFLQRYAQIIPQGSGSVSGIVLKYTKNGVTENTLRMRKLDDIAVSADAATRVSNTLVQFGPFDWNALPLETVTPVVGSGEVKSTAYRGVQSAGALNYGWSHTRKDTPAAITITPNGKQTSDPAVTQQMMYPYLYSSNFWNFTGSTMNRSGSDDPDYKGEAWVFNITDFRPSGGDLMLVFTTASSWGGRSKCTSNGPMRRTPRSTNTTQSPTISVRCGTKASSYHLKQFSVALPDELKTKSKFTIRFRNMATSGRPTTVAHSPRADTRESGSGPSRSGNNPLPVPEGNHPGFSPVSGRQASNYEPSKQYEMKLDRFFLIRLLWHPAPAAARNRL